MISAAMRAVERFLLPNSCIVCGRLSGAAAPDSLVCGPCRSRLRPVPPGCERCCQPLPPVGPCRFCLEWPEGFVHAYSAVWLGEEAREIVHHLKYEGYTRLAELAAGVIAHNSQRPPAAAALVPIPLGARRRIERGYNQAAEIARALAEIWSAPLMEAVIRRGHETTSQTTLTPHERARNVSGAFRAILPCSIVPVAESPGSRARSPDGARNAFASPSPVAILIDDVLTTGATLAAAAVALLNAGWAEVRAVTFARALPFAVRVETQGQ